MAGKKISIASFRFIGILLKYLFLTVAGGLILILIFLSTSYNNLQKAAQSGLAGKTDLTAAAAAAKSQAWPASLSAATRAESEFTDSLKYLGQARNNPALHYLAPLARQINDLEYLLKTGEILSRSLTLVLPTIQKLDAIRSGSASHNFADLSAGQKSNFLQSLYESAPEFAGLKANLDLAVLNLQQIHHFGVLWPIYGQISDLGQNIGEVAAVMNKLTPVIRLLPILAGTPDTSRFLLILQNNDELRPTGGFIGVYGILTINNGNIISLATDDSYHLDMPASLSAKWNLAPPAELQKYLQVSKWYLRDANWSPDWPQSARQITSIYNGEKTAIGQTSTMFSGVIAINPDLVADLIKLVGPISIQGATYNAANFQTLLQYNVEVAYKDQNISQWNRKNIINSLMDELKARLFNLPASNWPQLFNILDNNVAEKNIQLFFFNPAGEDLANALQASGEVLATDHDFLMTVDSNLAAFKSDAVVKKDLSYALTTDKNGAQATVTLNYRHEGQFDWRTTRYRSYTRIYAPLGSQFIALNGVDQATADISIVNDPVLNKTVFGFFFTVEPGSSRLITLSYHLPAAINEQLINGDYNLLIERQSGQRINSLTVNLDGKGKNKKWVTDLNNDKSFKLN